ncbi:hypothetical protein [Metabacillus indicus]|nr:hypothetical protein [Metabacillus indicus]
MRRKDKAMDWNDNDRVEGEKTKLLTKFGCFFTAVIVGFLIISTVAW